MMRTVLENPAIIVLFHNEFLPVADVYTLDGFLNALSCDVVDWRVVVVLRCHGVDGVGLFLGKRRNADGGIAVQEHHDAGDGSFVALCEYRDVCSFKFVPLAVELDGVVLLVLEEIVGAW